MKLGVIGLGRGQSVVKLAINEPTIKLRAICDKNPEKLAAIKVFIGFGANVGFDHNYSIYGTRSMLETDRTKPLKEKHTFARLPELDSTLTTRKVEMPITVGFPGSDISKGHGGADLVMLKDFAKCIIEDTDSPIDVDMGIQMPIPGLIAHESALMGGAPLEIPVID